MEEEESTEISESFQWKFTLLTHKKKNDSRTRLHSPHPTFVFYSFQFLSLHFHIFLACPYGKAFSCFHLSLNLHTQQQQQQKSSFYSLFLQGQNFQLTGGNLGSQLHNFTWEKDLPSFSSTSERMYFSEMTVMSVEGMHSLDAEVADAYTCEREMK
ncbi:hypothetical protein HKD37_05G014042 [Glycine soja]